MMDTAFWAFYGFLGRRDANHVVMLVIAVFTAAVNSGFYDCR